MTKAIFQDLSWVQRHLKRLNGIFLIKEQDWNVGEVDFLAYSDACLTGLGFWIPKTHEGYYADVPQDTPSEWIYYRETWGVLSVLYHAVKNQCL